MIFVVYGDFQRPKELLILRGQFDLSVRFKTALGLGFRFDLGVFIGLFSLVEAYGRLQNKEDIVPGAFDFTNRGGDAIGVRERLIDRVSEFLHQVFQFFFHRVAPFLIGAASLKKTRLVIAKQATKTLSG